jgi:hypothetical protein
MSGANAGVLPSDRYVCVCVGVFFLLICMLVCVTGLRTCGVTSTDAPPPPHSDSDSDDSDPANRVVNKTPQPVDDQGNQVRDACACVVSRVLALAPMHTSEHDDTVRRAAAGA